MLVSRELQQNTASASLIEEVDPVKLSCLNKATRKDKNLLQFFGLQSRTTEQNSTQERPAKANTIVAEGTEQESNPVRSSPPLVNDFTRDLDRVRDRDSSTSVFGSKRKRVLENIRTKPNKSKKFSKYDFFKPTGTKKELTKREPVVKKKPEVIDLID